MAKLKVPFQDLEQLAEHLQDMARRGLVSIEIGPDGKPIYSLKVVIPTPPNRGKLLTMTSREK